WLATLFSIAALSLAGLPPLSGFFGKFLLIRESVNFTAAPRFGYVMAILGVATSLLTLMSMLKIWSFGFWSPEPKEAVRVDHPPRIAGGLWSTALLVAVALSVGLGAGWYYKIARAAAQVVLSPQGSVEAVLGVKGGEDGGSSIEDGAPRAGSGGDGGWKIEDGGERVAGGEDVEAALISAGLISAAQAPAILHPPFSLSSPPQEVRAP